MKLIPKSCLFFVIVLFLMAYVFIKILLYNPCKKYVVDRQIVRKYDYVTDLDENWEALVKKNNLWGKIDENGNIIVPIQYEAKFFANPYLIIRKNCKEGIIDSTGVEICPPKFYCINRIHDSMAVLSVKKMVGIKFGFFNMATKKIIEPKYSGVKNFSEGVAAVCLNNKWGYIDKNGNVVIDFMFDYAYDFKEGYAAIIQNDKVGYINKSGEMVINPIYEIFPKGHWRCYADSSFSYRKFAQHKNISKIPPVIGDEARPFNQGRVEVYKDRLILTLDTLGKVISSRKIEDD